jgi:hypothetical protein
VRTGYLTALASRVLGAAPVLTPPTPSRFEPESPRAEWHETVQEGDPDPASGMASPGVVETPPGTQDRLIGGRPGPGPAQDHPAPPPTRDRAAPGPPTTATIAPRRLAADSPGPADAPRRPGGKADGGYRRTWPVAVTGSEAITAHAAASAVAPGPADQALPAAGGEPWMPGEAAAPPAGGPAWPEDLAPVLPARPRTGASRRPDRPDGPDGARDAGPAIVVRIGRVDVRAVQAAPPTAPTPRPRPAGPSLEEHLRARDRGRR